MNQELIHNNYTGLILFQIAEENIKPIKHITVTIALPPAEPVDDADTDDGDDAEEGDENKHEGHIKLVNRDTEDQIQEVPTKKKLQSLNSEKKRPRRAKRMKLARPGLDVISEDAPSTRAPTNVSSIIDQSTKSMSDSYHDLLEEITETNHMMEEQKKQTVALLKRTNYGSHTHQQEQRMTLQSYAKRKLRKLPPITTSTNTKMTSPSLKYTNGLDTSTSPYQHIRAN